MKNPIFKTSASMLLKEHKSNNTTKTVVFKPKKKSVVMTDTIKKCLFEDLEKHFFNDKRALERYNNYLDLVYNASIDTTHIKQLHDLGFLPLSVDFLVLNKTMVEKGKTVLKVQNTIPEFDWVVDYFTPYIETVLTKSFSAATSAFKFYKNFEDAVRFTGKNVDISSLGFYSNSSGGEDAFIAGAAHTLYFDNISSPAVIDFIKKYRSAYLEQNGGNTVVVNVDEEGNTIISCPFDRVLQDELNSRYKKFNSNPVYTIKGFEISSVNDKEDIVDELYFTLDATVVLYDGKFYIANNIEGYNKFFASTMTYEEITEYEAKGLIRTLVEEIKGQPRILILTTPLTLTQQKRLLNECFFSSNVVLNLAIETDGVPVESEVK